MGLFGKMFRTRPLSKSPQEWIAVHFELSSEFGSTEERAMVHKFTDKLASLIDEHEVGVFDGDEFGNGHEALFMYGPDADKLFDVVYPSLSTWEPLKGGYAIKRYGMQGREERIEF
jgi:hypothetical protein